MLHESRSDAGPQANHVLDLSDCATEPIHIPGTIQPHGLLLVLDEDGLIIRQASENSVELIDIPPDNLVEHSLDEILGTDQSAHLGIVLRGKEQIQAHPLKLRLPDRPEARAFNVLIHRIEGQLVFEAEPILDGAIGNFQAYYHEVRQATARLQATDSEEALCKVAADEVRRIIGFDRVMVYRFEADWHGKVIAESQDDQLETSYLGLHFPASDIPPQARELYTVNGLRSIPDVHYTPVKLFTGGNTASDRPLNMSQCVLRSVSPTHLEYLQNMGVQATLTVSLLQHGKLWGLIACQIAALFPLLRSTLVSDTTLFGPWSGCSCVHLLRPAAPKIIATPRPRQSGCWSGSAAGSRLRQQSVTAASPTRQLTTGCGCPEEICPRTSPSRRS